MNTTDNCDVEFLIQERSNRRRRRPNRKSLTPPSRNPNRYRFTFHAIQRMEERNVSSSDFQIILKYGRVVNLPWRFGIYLQSGEVPKGKGFTRKFSRLEHSAIVVDQVQPIVITTRPIWSERKLLFLYDNPRPTLFWHIRQPSNLPHARKLSENLNFNYPSSLYPPNLLYTFDTVQKMEHLGIRSKDIELIIRYGWRRSVSAQLSLIRIHRSSFEESSLEHELVMVIDTTRERDIVTNIFNIETASFPFIDQYRRH